MSERQDQTQRFKVGDHIWRKSRWSSEPAVVRKVTARQVVIQVSTPSWEKLDPNDYFKGSTWTVTGSDLDLLFPTKLDMLLHDREQTIAEREGAEKEVMRLETKLHAIEAEIVREGEKGGVQDTTRPNG